MTAMMLAGCILIAFGPPAILLLGYASRRAALLILTISSAFFWLLSIFLTSVIWIIIPPLKDTHVFVQLVGIFLQEIARFGLIWIYASIVIKPCRAERAADNLVRKHVGPKLFNDLAAGISAGLGFGAMHTVIMYGAVIAASGDEAAFYLDSCPSINMYIWTAVTALMYNILHIAWMVIGMEAFRRLQAGIRHIAYTWIAFVPLAMHLLTGLITLANSNTNGCEASLGVIIATTVLACVLVWRLERAPDYAAKKQIKAWETLSTARSGSFASSTAVVSPPT